MERSYLTSLGSRSWAIYKFEFDAECTTLTRR